MSILYICLFSPLKFICLFTCEIESYVDDRDSFRNIGQAKLDIRTFRAMDAYGLVAR